MYTKLQAVNQDDDDEQYAFEPNPNVDDADEY
jgi:hypothetical protein